MRREWKEWQLGSSHRELPRREGADKVSDQGVYLKFLNDWDGRQTRAGVGPGLARAWCDWRAVGGV
jgi:hypothetical protein